MNEQIRAVGDDAIGLSRCFGRIIDGPHFDFLTMRMHIIDKTICGKTAEDIKRGYEIVFLPTEL